MQISNCESGNEKHVQERGQWGRQVEWRITKRRSSDNQQSAERVNIEQSPLERQRFVLCDTGVHFSLDVLPS